MKGGVCWWGGGPYMFSCSMLQHILSVFLIVCVARFTRFSIEGFTCFKQPGYRLLWGPNGELRWFIIYSVVRAVLKLAGYLSVRGCLTCISAELENGEKTSRRLQCVKPQAHQVGPGTDEAREPNVLLIFKLVLSHMWCQLCSWGNTMGSWGMCS